MGGAYNPERHREYSRVNRVRIAARLKQWRLANKETLQAKRKDYCLLNSEAIKRRNAENYAKRGYDPIKGRAQTARYRAARQKATPSWLSVLQKLEIDYFYERAYKRSEETLVPYHVDHIVPLCGKTVCGLHVPWNLQILEDVANLSKGNRLEDRERDYARPGPLHVAKTGRRRVV